MNEAKLKKILTTIKENDFQLQNGMDRTDITETMLKYIGTTDPGLRDLLIYQTFYHWILKDKYADDELSEIAKIAIDEDHLLYGLGESDTDSVFTRAFSSLLCALILHADLERNYLSEEEFHQIKDTLFNYLRNENDIRGYVPEKGWAHGIAHGADALEELPHFEYMTEADLKELLNIARDKMATNEGAYICLEDQRMAAPIVTLFKQERLPEKDIFNWLESFNAIEKEFDWVEDRYAIHNLKLFLKSLYLKVVEKELDAALAEKIKEVIIKTR